MHVFLKRKEKEKDEFTFDKQKIQFMNEFKYLIITINRKGSFTPILNDLINNATNALSIRKFLLSKPKNRI